MRVGIVAAEPSGDHLGAGLMGALRERLPDVRFEGIGGPEMLLRQMDCWEPMESLSVMGLAEVLADLPRLLALRRRVTRRWLANPPDLFVGVDAPDFNLRLERRLREAGVPIVHYVSPTVWAWREGRVKDIRRSIDLLLCIFPFEPDFLHRHQIESVYVGHPFAREIPLQSDPLTARAASHCAASDPVLALLPGSRGSEVSRVSRPFLQTALALRKQLPDLKVLTPLANAKTGELFEQARREFTPDLDVRAEIGATRRFLGACDVALIASGTATFEALLLKKPMVVGYKLAPLTYLILRMTKAVRLPYYAMANILSGEGLAPEFLQHECEPDRLLPALLTLLRDEPGVRHIAQVYQAVHAGMTLDTNAEAAKAVCTLLESRRRA